MAHGMCGRGEIPASRREVVKRFFARRAWSSVDGFVHTDGDTLCAGPYHVAFWRWGLVYVVPPESSDELVEEVQRMARLETNSHEIVAETGARYG